MARIFVLAFMLSCGVVSAKPPSSPAAHVCEDEAGAEPENLPAASLRPAIEKSLLLLQRSAVGHREQRDCFACHQQGLPVMALTAARAKGFAVDGEELHWQLEHTRRFLGRNRDNYRQGKGQGGQVDMAGAALLALAAGNWPADDVTAAVAEYLLLRQAEEDHWTSASRRPPSEASPFSTTYAALASLAAYSTPAQTPRVAERRSKALAWLQSARPHDHEDRVFRLLALRAADAPADVIAAARQELLDRQREDGGWAQLDAGAAEGDVPEFALLSDPYATGTALVALHRAAELPTTHAAYQRGLRFLIDSQLPDGSWRVPSRSKPFQTYFESGYPHGKDQFISCAAAAWGTLALIDACPEP